MTQLIDGSYQGPWSPAVIAVDDPAIQFGAGGLFETFRVEEGRPHLFDAHMARLERSARFWNLEMPCERDRLIEVINDEIGSQPSGKARLRLTLGPHGQGTRIFIRASSLDEAYEGPIKGRPLYRVVVFDDYRISTSDPWNGHKSTQFYAYWEARRRVQRQGFDEAILLNERNEVAEGAMTNIFWICDETLFTPAECCGGLPGIFAAYLVGLCQRLRIDIHRTIALADELAAADALFFTNSLGEIMIARSLGSSRTWESAGDHPLLLRIIEAAESERFERGQKWSLSKS